MSTQTQSSVTDRKHSSITSLSPNGNDEQHGSPDAKSKRKSNASNGEDENGKKKRRKVNHACVYCRRSHMTCDLERPCARCVKRDIGHLCHDEPRDQPKRSKSEIGVDGIAAVPDAGLGEDMGAMNTAHAHRASAVSPKMPIAAGIDDSQGGPQLIQPTPVSPIQLSRRLTNPSTTSMARPFMPSTFDWNNSGLSSQFQDMHHLHPNYMFSNAEVTNEYNMLNEFLSNSLVDDGALYNFDSDAHQMFVNDPLLTNSAVNAMSNFPNFQLPPNSNNLQQQTQTAAGPSQPQASAPSTQPTTTASSATKTSAGDEISRPNSAFPTTQQSINKFYMTAADPAGLSSAEDRLHKLLKAKYDAGMLKPFNYVKGYARLNTYMSKNFTRMSQHRILRQLERFRPKFREATQKLTDMQLVLVEMWFERSLLEYDRVFASMAIPACCWRRTGEIFRGNREMAELIGVPLQRLRDGKLAIHEIIAEDSLVSYWEKFGAIAFDQSQKAILTSCSLRTPTLPIEEVKAAEKKDGSPKMHRRSTSYAASVTAGSAGDKKDGELIKCCFSFTIRRDSHNM